MFCAIFSIDAWDASLTRYDLHEGCIRKGEFSFAQRMGVFRTRVNLQYEEKSEHDLGRGLIWSFKPVNMNERIYICIQGGLFERGQLNLFSPSCENVFCLNANGIESTNNRYEIISSEFLLF